MVPHDRQVMLEPALISSARMLARQRNEVFDLLHCVATLLLYLGSAEWAGAVLAASISRTQRDAWLRLIGEAVATDPQPSAYAGGPTTRYVECERAWAEAATEHRAGLTDVLVLATILRSDGISAVMMRACDVDADALLRNLEVKIAQLDADSAADVPVPFSAGEPALVVRARTLVAGGQAFDTVHILLAALQFPQDAGQAREVLLRMDPTFKQRLLTALATYLEFSAEPATLREADTDRLRGCTDRWQQFAGGGMPTNALVLWVILTYDPVIARLVERAGVHASELAAPLEAIRLQPEPPTHAAPPTQLDGGGVSDTSGAPGTLDAPMLNPFAGGGPWPQSVASGLLAGGQDARRIPDDYASWSDYWAAQGMPWRTEPEIPDGRQRELAACRTREPDVARGLYPFSGIRLERAEIEWLLCTHTSGGLVGPIDVDDPAQGTREGLDLRGAILTGADLRGLPLRRLRGGLTAAEWRDATPSQRTSAALVLTDSNLSEAHLEEAVLSGAVAPKIAAGSPVIFAVSFYTNTPYPSGSFSVGDHRDFELVYLNRATLIGATLDRASLREAHLEDADLSEATLRGCDLTRAYLRGARARAAVLDGAGLQDADLEGADLRGASLDGTTRLNGARLDQALLDQVGYGGVNLAVIDWAAIRTLGDETRARRGTRSRGLSRHQSGWLRPFEGAARAALQLSTALRSQGLSEQADRFAYRARLLQRQVLRRQGPRKWPAYLGSWLLDLLAGYGYRPERSFLVYLVAIAGFAGAYHVLGGLPAPDAVVFSVTSFHGRGFSPSAAFTLHDPVAVLAAIEAFLGLLIEITFIATFTQRFFSR